MQCHAVPCSLGSLSLSTSSSRRNMAEKRLRKRQQLFISFLCSLSLSLSLVHSLTHTHFLRLTRTHAQSGVVFVQLIYSRTAVSPLQPPHNFHRGRKKTAFIFFRPKLFRFLVRSAARLTLRSQLSFAKLSLLSFPSSSSHSSSVSSRKSIQVAVLTLMQRS